VNKRKSAERLLMNSPLVKDLEELRSNPPSLPRPHRPTPMSQLSWPRKARRVTGFMFFMSSIALAVSAATASSDWNVKSGDYQPR
jgi:hypothetical protein